MHVRGLGWGGGSVRVRLTVRIGLERQRRNDIVVVSRNKTNHSTSKQRRRGRGRAFYLMLKTSQGSQGLRHLCSWCGRNASRRELALASLLLQTYFPAAAEVGEILTRVTQDLGHHRRKGIVSGADLSSPWCRRRPFGLMATAAPIHNALVQPMDDGFGDLQIQKQIRGGQGHHTGGQVHDRSFLRNHLV